MRVLSWVLAIVLLGWGISHLRAHFREAQAEAAFPPQGAFVEVNGTQVHYLEKGTGPDLILIHGLSGNLRDASFSLVDRLAQDYRVIAFDRPGMGYTDNLHDGGESITEQAALLSAAARQLGAERPIVLGQSYGGAVALAWAVEFPEALSAMVLVASPSLPWDTGMSLLYRVTSHRILGPLVVPFLAAWVPQGYVARAVEGVFAPQDMPPGYDAHIGAPLSIRRATLRSNALHRAGLLAQITALQARYGEITVPVELIHGTADTTVALSIHSAPLAERLPNAHLTPLDGIGHMPHHSREAAVVEAIHRARDRR